VSDWPALSEEALAGRVFAALRSNRRYQRDHLLGVPGSVLDRRVFPALPALDGFPLLATWIDNPNHIGCHTVGTSEPHFQGTHALEREVVALCAEKLLRAAPGTVDGYIASGGTESNLQALWTFRNAWRARGVQRERIGILASQDVHYSIPKAADLLDLPLFTVPVDEDTRRMGREDVERAVRAARDRGVDHLAVVLTLGTTMFGSIDRLEDVLPALEAHRTTAWVHVDGAFGGFLHPLTSDPILDFRHDAVVSFTLDAHKMLQAPYGTGIHLIRKGWIEHVRTPAASYVPGLDCTVSGSRSGGNAVAVWMILNAYGRAGGEDFCRRLVDLAERFVARLRAAGIRHYHHPGMNVVTLGAEHVPPAVATRFGLVADDARHPAWWKVVVMDHVTEGELDALASAVGANDVPVAQPQRTPMAPQA
jgi:glutamate/tyrosine decarboxylase-like PLP-dependent enzyme